MPISRNFRNPSEYLRVFVSSQIVLGAQFAQKQQRQKNLLHKSALQWTVDSVSGIFDSGEKDGRVRIRAQNIASKHVNYKTPCFFQAF